MSLYHLGVGQPVGLFIDWRGGEAYVDGEQWIAYTDGNWGPLERQITLEEERLALGLQNLKRQRQSFIDPA